MGVSSAVEDFDDLVRSRLRERDVRYTSGRERILMILESAAGPRSAAELHSVSGDDLPLSSIYRTLTVLNEAGVLDRTHGTNGVAMFEVAEWLRGHHHHVVCIQCGSVEDVDVSSTDEESFGELADRVAASRGFTALGHRIDIEGICGRCSS